MDSRVFSAQFTKALEDCNKALALDSRAAGAYGARGAVQTQLRNFEAGVGDLTKAISLDTYGQA